MHRKYGKENMVPRIIKVKKEKNKITFLYACSNCGTSFEHFKTKERFCHMCGVRSDWQGVILKMSYDFYRANYKNYDEMINRLNTCQESKLFFDEMERVRLLNKEYE